MRKFECDDQQECLASILKGVLQRLDLIEHKLLIEQEFDLHCPKCDEVLEKIESSEGGADAQSYYCSWCEETVEFKSCR